jgi:5-formyltetrahydrofolate cyclo-ligase
MSTADDTTASTKALLRQQFRAQRQALLPVAQPAIETQALQHVPGLLSPGQLLGLYWPLPGEVDLRTLRTLLPGRVALPAITHTAEDGGAQLVYRPWDDAEALAPDGCGIPAPPASNGERRTGELGGSALEPERLGLLLVPTLACDAAGIRLGYGGGWYDRLRADPAWARVPALAVLPQGCRVEHLPRDPWDVPLQGWLDENGPCWLKAAPRC